MQHFGFQFDLHRKSYRRFFKSFRKRGSILKSSLMNIKTNKMNLLGIYYFADYRLWKEELEEKYTRSLESKPWTMWQEFSECSYLKKDNLIRLSSTVNLKLLWNVIDSVFAEKAMGTSVNCNMFGSHKKIEEKLQRNCNKVFLVKIFLIP